MKKSLLLIAGLLFSLVGSTQLLVNVVNSSTLTSCNGSATLIDSTAINASTITWMGNGAIIQQGGLSISNLCPGSYVVVYSTTSGSTSGNVSCTFMIGSGNANPCVGFTASVSTVQPVAGSVCSGSASVNVTGGISPYTYYWSNGSTSSAIGNLCPGVYTCNVISANGCQATAVGVINTATPCNLLTNITSIPASDSLTCDGTSVVTVLGGMPPYSYQWSTNPSQTNAIVTNLCSGYYACHVTDANGCQTTDSTYIDYIDTVTITNTTFPNNAVVGSLGNATTINCTTNFSLVTSATIGGFSYQTVDTVLITWNLYNSTGALIYTTVVPYVVPNPLGGIYSAALTINCFQKSFAIKHFQVVDQLQLSPNTLGVEESHLDAFTVINPFDNHLKLVFKSPTAGTVSLYNIQGALVHQRTFSTSNALNIDTEKLVHGTYFLHVNNGKEVIVRKVIN